ncbi:T6SS effector amidase Tae4 family protein [[Empedobacter] haloabium]|uniref:T6SS effector amidase Tae4 family protein n=1 Tax=[Empedobacter] haloabium TaxID=592317 RepID=A0ABZ1URS7_9BURK
MRTTSYATLRMHFPDPYNVSAEELYRWVGHPDLIKNPNYWNTCALRLSLALLGAGFADSGAFRIRDGKHKGRSVEIRQHALSTWLLGQVGQPEKFKGDNAYEAIGLRRGIVSFFNLYDDSRGQGHIAIIAPDRRGAYLRCGRENDGDTSGCYWTSREIWFWPLP